MRFSLILKGLSYVPDASHENDTTNQSYSVDFRHSVQSFKDKIIHPLREKGHEVDIFFHTNTSEKLEEFIRS